MVAEENAPYKNLWGDLSGHPNEKNELPQRSGVL
jgi:hypothetical protein